MKQKEAKNPYRTLQMIFLVGVIVALPLISFIINMKGAEKGRAFYGDIKNNFSSAKRKPIPLKSY